MTNDDLHHSYRIAAVQWHHLPADFPTGHTEEDERIRAAAAALRIIEEGCAREVAAVMQRYGLPGWSGALHLSLSSGAAKPCSTHSGNKLPTTR